METPNLATCLPLMLIVRGVSSARRRAVQCTVSKSQGSPARRERPRKAGEFGQMTSSGSDSAVDAADSGPHSGPTGGSAVPVVAARCRQAFGRPVHHDVAAPDVVRVCRPWPDERTISKPGPSSLRLSRRPVQALLPPDSRDPPRDPSDASLRTLRLRLRKRTGANHWQDNPVDRNWLHQCGAEGPNPNVVVSRRAP